MQAYLECQYISVSNMLVFYPHAEGVWMNEIILYRILYRIYSSKKITDRNDWLVLFNRIKHDLFDLEV